MIVITKSYLRDLAAKGMSAKDMCVEIKNAYGSPISLKDVKLHLAKFGINLVRKRKPVYEFIDDDAPTSSLYAEQTNLSTNQL